MTLKITPSGQACGASAEGVDLAGDLSGETIAAIRAAWLEHRVLSFPAQTALDDDGLERFTVAMGGFGDDPFFDPIPGREHIAAILREADERSPLFAENWHTDWSFLAVPPAGTCLLSIDVPETGGDTMFADQIAAFAALPAERQDELRKLTAIHSARSAYSPDGAYGERDKDRSMAIRPSEDALATQTHPLIRKHPETGEEGIFSCAGYIVGIEGMAEDAAQELLMELYHWQTQDRFVYRHKWEPDMLIMWDNRSLLHQASGGYDGHRRELHRTTIAAFAG